MRKLAVFDFITLNGYFEGPQKGDIGWHRHAADEKTYAIEGLKSESILLFGRVTYEMMAGYWTLPTVMENDPVVAKSMNKAEKIVFSRSLKKAEWEGTKIVTGDIVQAIRQMKQEPGKDMRILGSGSIVTLFAEEGLIDEYDIMLDPVAIGSGTTLFGNIRRKLDLQLTDTRVFKSGAVLLSYRPF